MRYRDDVLEDLVRRAAMVRDEDLSSFADTAAARALFDEVAATPGVGIDVPMDMSLDSRGVGLAGKRARGRRTAGRRRVTQVALAVVLVLGVGLSVPAFGVVQNIKSWLAGGKGPDAPNPTQPDVVIASGVDGVPWRIVATQTDQGLCLFSVFKYEGEKSGTGGCGWGTDIQGYPDASPHGYGSGGDQLHWVEGSNGSGGDAALNRRIVQGVAAVDVASVDLVLAGGQTMHANVVEQPEGIDPSLNFWWAVLPAQVDGVDLTTLESGGSLIPVHEMIASDSSGTVLERRIVDLPNG